MKQRYQTPTLHVLELSDTDVIRTSPVVGEDTEGSYGQFVPMG